MLIPAGYAQVNWFFSGPAAPEGAQVTMGLDISSYLGTVASLASDMADEWQFSLLPNQVDGLNFDGVLVKAGPNATGPSAVHSVGAVGGVSGTGAPANTSALIRKNTGDGGRAGRGRMYFPGVPAAQVNEDGTIGSTYATNLQADLVTFLGGAAGYGLSYVVLHGVGSPISTPSEITSLSLQSKAATQRRRLR